MEDRNQYLTPEDQDTMDMMDFFDFQESLMKQGLIEITGLEKEWNKFLEEVLPEMTDRGR